MYTRDRSPIPPPPRGAFPATAAPPHDRAPLAPGLEEFGGTGSRRTLWLRLAAWHAGPYATLDELDRARRSRLLAWVFLGLVATVILVVGLGAADQNTLLAMIFTLLALVIAIAFNRFGHVDTAAWIGIVAFAFAIMWSITQSENGLVTTNHGVSVTVANRLTNQGLTVDALPGYDYLVLPLVIAVAGLRRVWLVWLVALINCVLIAGDYVLQPHAPDITVIEGAFYGGEPATGISLLGRPIGIQIALALILFLLVAGYRRFAERAFHAEEIAEARRLIAERGAQDEVFVQQVAAVLVSLANVDLRAQRVEPVQTQITLPSDFAPQLRNYALLLSQRLARIPRVLDDLHFQQLAVSGSKMRLRDLLRRLAQQPDHAYSAQALEQLGRLQLEDRDISEIATLVYTLLVTRAAQQGPSRAAPPAHAQPAAYPSSGRLGPSWPRVNTSPSLDSGGGMNAGRLVPGIPQDDDSELPDWLRPR